MLLRTFQDTLLPTVNIIWILISNDTSFEDIEVTLAEYEFSKGEMENQINMYHKKYSLISCTLKNIQSD